jgi:hypothetical protein
MANKSILWIKIVSGYINLLGFLYLKQSIVLFSVIVYVKDPKWVSALPGAVTYLAFAICFIIGGTNLFFIKYWARYFVLIILGIDVLTTRWIELIFIWSSFRAVQPPQIRFDSYQSLLLINIAIEIIVFWYLCRKSIGEILLPNKNELREAEMVHLITVPNDIEAVMVCDLLKQARIEASTRGGALSGLIKISTDEMSTSYWWTEILVLDDNYNTAKEIVDGYLKTLDNQKKDET